MLSIPTWWAPVRYNSKGRHRSTQYSIPGISDQHPDKTFTTKLPSRSSNKGRERQRRTCAHEYALAKSCLVCKHKNHYFEYFFEYVREKEAYHISPETSLTPGGPRRAKSNWSSPNPLISTSLKHFRHPYKWVALGANLRKKKLKMWRGYHLESWFHWSFDRLVQWENSNTWELDR